MRGGRRRASGVVTKPKINTMEQLSEAIGVSRPTLSRYFQDPQSVRGTTAAKIRQGLDRVDYVPNFFATRLNRKSSGLIGVILPHLNDLFYTNLLEAIERAACEADFTVITQSSHGNAELEAVAIEKLMSMNAEGVIVAPLGETGAVGALARLGTSLPLVFVDSRLPNAMPETDFVGTDNRQSIGVMVEYLCRTGAPPVYLGMPRVNSNSQERERAYRDRMADLGAMAEVIDNAAGREGWAFEAFAHDVMDRHFGRGLYCDATILCANDRLGIGALRAAMRHGLFRPGETRPPIRIAGHDDHPLSRFMTPSLTTVSQNKAAIGRAAVQLLIQRMRRDGPSTPVQQTFEAVLEIRESA